MNVAAKETMAMVYTHDVCARFHPNSFSSGRTNTLQAYNEPSARLREMPPTIGSHRFMRRILSRAAFGVKDRVFLDVPPVRDALRR
jgi:hypothetical protein